MAPFSLAAFAPVGRQIGKTIDLAKGKIFHTKWSIKQAKIQGNQGELIAITTKKNTARIPSETGTAKYRVPDELAEYKNAQGDIIGGTLREIKTYRKTQLRYTSQIKDYLAYCEKHNLKFELVMPPNPKIHPELLNVINSGRIKLIIDNALK